MGSMKCPVAGRNGRNEGPWRASVPARQGLRVVAGRGGVGCRFSDEVPPPLEGRLGDLAVRLHVWPPDVIPSHPEAFRPRAGVLAGYWVLLRFP